MQTRNDVAVLPTLAVADIRELDRCAIEEFGVPGVVLMENAGRQAAQEVLQSMDDTGSTSAVVYCGKGNNAGDGFVVARYLRNAKMGVTVILVSGEDELRGDALVNFEIVKRMKVPIVDYSHGFQPDLSSAVVVDAMFGTGLNGPLRDPYADIVAFINNEAKSVVSMDIPSGIDGDTGIVSGEAVKADKTVTFAAKKKGFYMADGPAYCGEVVVKDISIPRQCYK